MRHAFPNPFNPSTVFNYGIPSDGRVNISVHDVNGRIVDVLTDGIKKSGNHSIEWNGNNQPTGLYLIKVKMEIKVSYYYEIILTYQKLANLSL